SNQQLAQKVQEVQKQIQLNEEKLIKELNENRTLHINQLNEFKCRIEQLEIDNEKLRQEKIQFESLQPLKLNNEEREQYQQEINRLKQELIEENEQYKKKINEIQVKIIFLFFTCLE
ncbi:unnamed protein product, partial [Rotaria sp. Silwood1]